MVFNVRDFRMFIQTDTVTLSNGCRDSISNPVGLLSANYTAISSPQVVGNKAQ